MIVNKQYNYSSKEILNAILKKDFHSYMKKVFYEVSGENKFLDNWHIKLLCEELEKVRLGETKRLIINIPPRSLKSIIVNVAFSTWILAQKPSEKVISVSYNNELSEKFARDSKIVMTSPWYEELFPRSVISKSRSVSNDFNTVSRGGRFATSIEGTLTGRGGNIIIIDDPIKPSEVMSETAINKVNDWYSNTLLSRLDDKENGAIIVIMQRVHENDLTGYLLDNSTEWRHIKIPLIATENETWQVGKTLVKRNKGEVLNPNQISLDMALNIKNAVGAFVWANQYQQEDCPLEGGLIKEEWLKTFRMSDGQVSFLRIYLSFDTASKTGELNAYTTCCVMGLASNKKIYLIEVIRGRYEMPELVKLAIEKFSDYSSIVPTIFLIEDKASGTALIQLLRSISYRYVVEAIIPNMDKISRLKAASVVLKDFVLIPSEDELEEFPWLIDFKKELLKFPHSKYSDQVDAFSQGISYIIQNK